MKFAFEALRKWTTQHVKLEDTVKSNEILEEETQSLSLRRTKPIVAV